MVRTVMTFTGDTGGFFRQMAAAYPSETSRAVRHTAYMAATRLKAEFLANVPGGRRIEPVSKIQRYRNIDYIKRNKKPGAARARGLAYGMNGGDWPIGGKLAQMIKYRMGIPGSTRSMVASIGWLGTDARTGARYEAGQRTMVTPAVRRLFVMAGLNVPRKSFIDQPARPVIRYFFEGRRAWMEGVLVARIRRNVNAVAARTIRTTAGRVVRMVSNG